VKSMKCVTCSVPIHLDDETYQRRQSDGQTFYCPNGHKQYFGDSEVSKLQKEVKRLAANCDFWEKRSSELHDENYLLHRRINGYKGQLARMRNRIKELEGGSHE
jgi:DNA gyrase/topoisomerase IV subunit B